MIACIEGEKYRQDLFSTSKYKEGKRLEPYGFKVYSQCDEDGIIQESFSRIGIDSKKVLLNSALEGSSRCPRLINI
jgi:hypothetical protein